MGWLDNGDGYLGYCDLILMIDKHTGWEEVFHVESLSTDMWLTISHDINVTKVSPLKTVVGQNFTCHINVAVLNEGAFTETFNVTLYADKDTTIIGDEIRIGNQTIPSLPSGDSTTITFPWNTTGVPKGNYTISAYAWPVPGEIDIADNTRIDGWVIVAMIGDITGPDGWPDGKCDMRDVRMVAKGFGANHVTDPTSPKYCQYWHPTPCSACPHSPNCDVTGPTPGVPDGKIDMRDIREVAKRFGQVDP